MKKVYFFIILAAFLFGTMEVALKIAASDMDPLQLTFLRFFIGGIVLIPAAAREMKSKKTIIKVQDLVRLLILGTLCVPVSMVLFQLGVDGSNASTAAVIFSVNPLFTMILAHFFAGESMNRNKGIAFFLGLAGIIAMMRPWDVQAGNSMSGMFFSVLAAAFFGIYTVMGKNSVVRLGAMVQTCISFIMGSLALLIIMVIMGRPVIDGISDDLLLLLYVSVFITGLGYLAYFIAIRYSDATTGSVTFFIKPMIAPIIAALVLGDIILSSTYAGIGLILMASLININENRKLR